MIIGEGQIITRQIATNRIPHNKTTEIQAMNDYFARTLRSLRTERGLTQQELAKQLYVTRSTVGRWENGTRLPDATMISRLSQCLGVDVGTLMSPNPRRDESPNVILVDDREIVLAGALSILHEALPNATITGFIRPSEAIEYAKNNRVALAFLDIELGKLNGLELCRMLLAINPRTNVIYLTAFSEYAVPAWSTGASGYMLKPITVAGVQAQLKNLRYPLMTGGTGR